MAEKQHRPRRVEDLSPDEKAEFISLRLKRWSIKRLAFEFGLDKRHVTSFVNSLPNKGIDPSLKKDTYHVGKQERNVV